MQEIRERCIEDIPETTNTIITKYQIERRYCRDCKKLVETKVKDALPNSRFGLRLMLLVTFMKLGLALPSQKIVGMLKAQYNLTISDGEIYKMLEQVAQAFGSHYNELHKKIKEVSVKNVDETGWRINGKSHWLWIFIDKETVLYVIRKRRSSSVPIKILGNQKDKFVTNDRHSLYNVLAQKSKCLLQICWTHLLRNSKDLAEHYEEVKYIHKRFKNIFRLARSYNHHATKKQIEDLLHKIDLVAEKRYKKRYKHSEVRKFIKSVCKFHRENLFRFVVNLEVEGTNNRAERELREIVVQRKISSLWNEKGVRIKETIMSCLATWRLRGLNTFSMLRQTLSS